jgi:catechol 2,3-dioxygenase-like lactoylglutathione lyase family enzyme
MEGVSLWIRQVISLFGCMLALAGSVNVGLAATASTAARDYAGPATSPIIRPLAVIHTVADLTASLRFYRAVGLQPSDSDSGSDVFPYGGDSRALQTLIAAPTGQVRVATLSIPGSELHLVLLQLSAARHPMITAQMQDPGTVRLALRVRDLDKAFSGLRAAVPTVYTTGGAPIHPEGDSQPIRAVVVKDPDGFQLEMVSAPLNLKTTAPSDSNIVGGFGSVVVADAAQTATFYQQQLGFRLRNTRQLPAGVLALEGTPEASVTSLSFQPPGASFMWFMYDFRHINRTVQHEQLNQIGSSAISLLTSDLPALLQSFKGAGSEVVTRGEKPVTFKGTRAVLVRDPSNTLIELVQQRP